MVRGCIFVASKGSGWYQLPLFVNVSSSREEDEDEDEEEGEDDNHDNDNDESLLGAKKIQVSTNDGMGNIPIYEARFCIGVENMGKIFYFL